MSGSIRFHLAQINPVVGDLEGNCNKITDWYKRAMDDGSQCVIFPELSIAGYPPQDLLLLDHFVRDNLDALESLAGRIGQIPAIVGFVHRHDGDLYSAAAVIRAGAVQEVIHKRLLPTYDVFDEDRYFRTGAFSSPVTFATGNEELRLGVHMCEDLWDQGREIKVVDELAGAGADLFINLSASPYYIDKRDERIALARRKTEAFGTPFLYCNQVGGQDELIFDGNSFALDAGGEVIGLAKAFEEDLIAVEIDPADGNGEAVSIPDFSREEEQFRALVLGLRDYCRKSGFKSAVLGLSGGIDSSLTAVIACEALGPTNVHGLCMPSHYSSQGSINDSAVMAENLGMSCEVIEIHKIYHAYLEQLESALKGTAPDTTEENIQARIRGNLLMAYSNKFGHLVLSTGNKTELALGYCTLYGDMTGGLAVISDVNKLDVYRICEWYNASRQQEIIPENVLTKTPSAELKDDQEDPFDYEVVSPLVEEIVENHRDYADLVDRGYNSDLVREIMRKIRLAEYKRRQAAPGLKVRRKSFGSGRRMPIISHYREEES